MKKYLFGAFCSFSILLPVMVLAQTTSPSPTPASGPDLGSHITQQVDNRLSQSDSSSGLKLFTSRSADQATRNSSSWTQKNTALNFTGIVGWNSEDFIRHGGALITPKHLLTSDHQKFAVGTDVIFFDQSGNPIKRKVVDSKSITGAFLDINVAQLDSDVDSSITKYQLISYANLQKTLQQSYPQTLDVPVVVFNQQSESLVMNMVNIFPNELTFYPYNSGAKANYSKSIVTGDSGQPIFIIINNKPILIATNYMNNAGSNFGNYIAEINSAISSMGSNYRVSEYIPSAFAQYNLVYYPAPLNFTAAGPSSCLSTSQGKVNLSWQIPSGEIQFITNYSLSIDGGSPLTLSASPTSYTHTAGPGNHSYTLKAIYGQQNNSSSNVNAQFSMPSLCVNPPSGPSTPSPSPSNTSSPGSNTGGNTSSGNIGSGSTPSPTPTNTSSPGQQNSGGTNSGQTSGNSSSNSNVSSGGGSSSYSSGGSSGYSSGFSSWYVYQGAGSASAKILKLGDRSEEVRSLQQVLNALGFKIAAYGSGSPGQETNYFGPATRAALIRYQTLKASGGATIVYGILDNVTRSLLSADLAKLSSQRPAVNVQNNQIKNNSSSQVQKINNTSVIKSESTPKIDEKVSEQMEVPVDTSTRKKTLTEKIESFATGIGNTIGNVLHFFKLK